MKKLVFVAIFATLILSLNLLTSCVSRLGAFTVISTKNIDWSRAAEYQRSSKRVDGEDVCHIIIFIPTKMNITIEDAVDDALGKVPGAVALVDAVLRSKFFYIPYIYGQQAYIVEGSVLIDPKLAAIDNVEETIYYQGYYDKNKDFKISKIDQTVYSNMKDEYQLETSKLIELE